MLKFKMLKFGFLKKRGLFFLEFQPFLGAKNRKLGYFEAVLGQRNKTIEAHEGHGEDAGSDQGDGDTLHALGHSGELHLLADAGKDDERQGEADGNAGGIDNALQQVHVLLHNQDGHTKDGTVGGDEGQEDTQGLVEGGGNLLEDDFYHLDKAGYDEDVGNGLEVAQIEGHQDIIIDKVGDEGGKQHDEKHGSTHAD